MIFYILYKSIRKISNEVSNAYDKVITLIKFGGNRVSYKSFRSRGVPYIMVAAKAKGITIGANFAMNNGIGHNPIGCPQPCSFFVDNNSEIIIGDNVGISQTALISHCSIRIGNNVKIGGGTCIYTTDFHSLDASIRASKEDQKHRVCKPVVIEDNVFIGAHSIILKGVTIGMNSIIGAGSVVTKSIPANQIWAGNPAKFIRDIKVESTAVDGESADVRERPNEQSYEKKVYV